MTRARADLIVGLTVLLALVGVVQLITYGLFTPDMADWWSYHDGASRLVSSGTPYSAMQSAPYPLHEAAWGDGFVYPPPAAVLLLPTLLGAWTFYALNLAGVVAFVGVAVLIARQERLGRIGVLLIGALALAHPGFQEVREGQISPLIAAGVGALWLLPRASGWLAVVTGMVKAYPGIGLVWALRQRAPLRGPILLGIGMVLATGWLWPGWIDAMLNAQPGCPAWSLPSIACTTGIRWAGYIVGGGLALLAWRLPSDRVAFLVLTLAMLAPAPDLYWGYWMVPFMGALPLGIDRGRWLTVTRPAWRSRTLASSSQIG